MRGMPGVNGAGRGALDHGDPNILKKLTTFFLLCSVRGVCPCVPPMHPPITLLDGSIGHSLKASGAIPADAGFLAVATLAASDPAPIAALAAAYARSGAAVLTAPNFGVTPGALERAGLPDTDLEPLTAACVAAVRAGVSGAAAASASAPLLVAGCLPPLGPDCYAPAPAAVAAGAASVHARIASALLRSGVDVLLAETVSSSDDAAAALAGAWAAAAAFAGGGGDATAAGVNDDDDGDGDAAASQRRLPARSVPVWIAWTLDDTAWPPRLRGGEYLADAAASLAAVEAGMVRGGAARGAGAAGGPGPRPRPRPPAAVTAHLINCSSPAAVAAGIRVLRHALPPPVAVGGYANGFRRPTSAWLAGEAAAAAAANAAQTGGEAGSGGGEGGGAAYGRDGLITPGAYAAAAAGWVEAGATIVGGCCGVGPAHVAAVREHVRRAGL